MFSILADMGDKRVLTLTINTDGKKVNGLFWTDALKLGEVHVAAKHSYLSGAKKYIEASQYSNSEYPDFNSKMQEVDLSKWSVSEYPDFSTKVPGVDLSKWSIPQLQVAQTALLKQYTTLPVYVRFELVRQLGSSHEIWNNELISMALHDSYAPVRLAMLQILLYQPRPELNPEINQIYKNDPIPWCRRLANEILHFESDPLNPDTGIFFKFGLKD